MLLAARPEAVNVGDFREGLLPLHGAAWANAPTWVAVMICAAAEKGPAAALEATTRRGETAYDIGLYHHPGNFRWPPASEIFQRAERLKMRRQCAALREALGTCAGLALAPTLQYLCEALTRRLRLSCTAAERLLKYLAPP